MVFSCRQIPGLAVVVSLANILSGCATLALPDRFLVVEQSMDELKAITPDEAKVWLREFEAPGGDLAFWIEALELDFVGNRGYVLLGKKDIKDAAGVAGRELWFETQAQGRPVQYLISVFVTPAAFGASRILTIEYSAEKDVFSAHLDDVRNAVAAHR